MHALYNNVMRPLVVLLLCLCCSSCIASALQGTAQPDPIEESAPSDAEVWENYEDFIRQMDREAEEFYGRTD